MFPLPLPRRPRTCWVSYTHLVGIEDKIYDNTVVQVMERLIRKLLDLPGKPAVVMMQVGASARLWGRLFACLSARLVSFQLYC